jgi:hypothetical protein
VVTATCGRGEQNVGVPAGFTVVVCVAVSLAELRSSSDRVTVAVLEYVPAAVGVTTRETVAEAPTAMLPSEQVTVGAAKAQDPWLGVEDVYVAPVWTVSVTVTFVAGSGPALDTVMV